MNFKTATLLIAAFVTGCSGCNRQERSPTRTELVANLATYRINAPQELLDIFYCQQMGVRSDNPTGCNSKLVGDRSNKEYADSVVRDFQCWRQNICPDGMHGSLPIGMFDLESYCHEGSPLGFAKAHRDDKGWAILVECH